MPPIASSLIDVPDVSVVRAWIRAMSPPDGGAHDAAPADAGAADGMLDDAGDDAGD